MRKEHTEKIFLHRGIPAYGVATELTEPSSSRSCGTAAAVFHVLSPVVPQWRDDEGRGESVKFK